MTMNTTKDDDLSRSGAGRSFRLFVSSTFSDLQEERDALHREVFPKLRDLCTQHGARFQVIDLRWGVSTEAGLDQKTMPLCLGEIERCQETDKPNFLVLLGDRYGWRPLPAEIPKDEFDQITAHLSSEQMEDEQALLEEWYLRDDNARYRKGGEVRPTVYYLRPRAKEGPYGDSAQGWRAWEKAEHDLGEILRTAVEKLGFSDPDEVKYLASATEQEIRAGALAVEDAGDHVYCFFRSIDGLPHDETSKGFEDLKRTNPDSEGWAEFEPDTDAADRLSSLKASLTECVGKTNVFHYSAQWSPFQGEDRPRDELVAVARSHCGKIPTDTTDGETFARLPGHATTAHLSQLCTDVLERLTAVIERRFAEGADKTQLQIEDEAHLQFARDRAQVFVGREEPQQAIAAHLASRPGRLLVVFGESGSGKSALMAKAALDAADSTRGQVLRFVGITTSSSEGRSLLADLCRQISARYGDESAVPADSRELVQEFPRRLELATADQPLTLFIDAVDQLGRSDPARTLTWLPAQLPDHVAVVVSTLPGDTLKALQAKRPEAEFVEVSPMRKESAQELLNTWLAAVDRGLRNTQKDTILDKFQDNGLPLYLKLAFEEARLWRSSGKDELDNDIPGVIRHNLFSRLDNPENHGEVLVSRALGYLAASRYGLAEDELLSVLSQDETVMSWIEEGAHHELPEHRIPVVLWARLYADLEPYLTEHATEGATVLTFYHRQFGEVARKTYLGDGNGTELHRNLAAYFRSRVDPDGDGTWTGQDLRGLNELPYHLTEADDWDAVENVLTDFRFMERKAAEVGVVDQISSNGDRTKLYTGVYQLRDDYDHALRRRAGRGDDPRHRIIVTGVDLGNGLEIRCPHCNRMIPWKEEYRGEEMPCPLTNPDCGGPLKVNPFVVGEQA
jgi:hypothetical protein